MMAKKKCPVCGVKNDKERMVCIECGAPFTLERVEGELVRAPTEVEAQVKTDVEKARKEKVADEYWDNEKVLYETNQPTAHETTRRQLKEGVQCMVCSKRGLTTTSVS